MDVIRICDLETVPVTQNKSIRGVVTLLWPFSSSTKKIAFLLAEPDFRLRYRKGQVRIQLYGPAALAVARMNFGIGDTIELDLAGAQWLDNEPGVSTPGKSVELELGYMYNLALRITTAAQEDHAVHVNEQPPRVEDSSPQNTPVRPAWRPSSGLRRHSQLSLQSPATPAFHRKVRTSEGSSVDSPLEPFQDSTEQPRKKLRMSWGSKAKWKMENRVPSPKKANDEDDVFWLVGSQDPPSPQHTTGEDEGSPWASLSPVSASEPDFEIADEHTGSATQSQKQNSSNHPISKLVSSFKPFRDIDIAPLQTMKQTAATSFEPYKDPPRISLQRETSFIPTVPIDTLQSTDSHGSSTRNEVDIIDMDMAIGDFGSNSLPRSPIGASDIGVIETSRQVLSIDETIEFQQLTPQEFQEFHSNDHWEDGISTVVLEKELTVTETTKAFPEAMTETVHKNASADVDQMLSVGELESVDVLAIEEARDQVKTIEFESLTAQDEFLAVQGRATTQVEHLSPTLDYSPIQSFDMPSDSWKLPETSSMNFGFGISRRSPTKSISPAKQNERRTTNTTSVSFEPSVSTLDWAVPQRRIQHRTPEDDDNIISNPGKTVSRRSPIDIQDTSIGVPFQGASQRSDALFGPQEQQGQTHMSSIDAPYDTVDNSLADAIIIISDDESSDESEHPEPDQSSLPVSEVPEKEVATSSLEQAPSPGHTKVHSSNSTITLSDAPKSTTAFKSPSFSSDVFDASFQTVVMGQSQSRDASKPSLLEKLVSQTSSNQEPTFSRQTTAVNDLFGDDVKEASQDRDHATGADEIHQPQPDIVHTIEPSSQNLIIQDFGQDSGYEQIQTELLTRDGSIPASTAMTDTQMGPATQHDLASLIDPPHPPYKGLHTSFSYYVPLSKLANYVNKSSTYDGIVDVLAVVYRDTTTAAKADKGPKDWYTKMRVTQPGLWKSTTLVQVFRRYKDIIPAAEQGDVVLLRSFTVVAMRGGGYGLKSREDSAWVVFKWGQTKSKRKPAAASSLPPHKMQEISTGPPAEYGDEERGEAEKLKAWWNDVQFQSDAAEKRK